MKSCSSVVFFEVRKKKDLYIWMSKSPAGPSVKFLVQNVHTMAELKLSGNHLKGSRPVLSFDKAFDGQPHLQLVKEMLGQIFTTPRRHHKSKPFFDHVLSFSVADDRIWMRNYQVVAAVDKRGETSLVEVGPRMCLNPIKIFDGSFGGAALYENAAYVSPNAVRSAMRKQLGARYKQKVVKRVAHKAHVAANPLPRSAVDEVFRGGSDIEDDEDSE
uniref:Brix domain-containing protein n=1 Tax=Chlamydomonas euryale TaxID=1486919 RepID=A0A7R9UZK9_9CHLO